MNTSNQQYYGSNAYPNRSDLISGLRTEGLGLGSIFPSQTNSQQSSGRNSTTPPFQQQQQMANHRQQQSNGFRAQDSLRDISALQASLEDQLAAMRLQSNLSHGQSDAQSGYQGYQPGYGHQQHQPQQHQYAQHNGHSQHQQQQYMQMQLQQQFAQQQAAVQQQQMELLRLQAIQKQQQQQQQYGGYGQYNQQQLAAQQRFLLSQLQGGNVDDHAALMNQAHVAAASAQEQRQAAQASIQASLRQRQVQQLYQTMGLDNDATGSGYYNSAQQGMQQQQQQQQQQTQQQLQLQNILNRHSRQVSSEGPSPSRTPLEQRSWRGGALPNQDRMPTPPGQRGASPASSVHSRRGVRPSSGTADSILSMRSRTMTPSIVIDDSASESSRAQSEYDQVEGDQTPETSEENVEVNTPAGKGLSSTPRPHNSMTMAQTQGGANNSRYGSLGRGVVSAPTSTSTTPPITAPKPIARAIHLSAAPQHRAFKAGSAASDGHQTVNNGGLTLPPIQPRRQPKGQPTEFLKVNFQARTNSRLRKDAMSKLCASPRAASFGGNGMSFGSRLSSAGSSVGGSAAS
ncbi:hypothetical protein PHBOTO_005786 [Pseudozyma hubeiensis]|nr:hypothetical protein PHBOTO_005786 [Pseudozyma hubeiensis]